MKFFSKKQNEPEIIKINREKVEECKKKYTNADDAVKAEMRKAVDEIIKADSDYFNCKNSDNYFIYNSKKQNFNTVFELLSEPTIGDIKKLRDSF